MITYIKGPITFKSPAFIVIEAAGIGYQVNISLQTYAKIEPLEEARILTHLHIKEDAHTLFGFAEEGERKLFRLLIGVSGIGPATAQLALSSLSAEDIRAAIIGEDVNAFKLVKGIGPKTAKRIILDLKDKLLKDGGDLDVGSKAGVDNTMREAALEALVTLGYSRIPVQKALNTILRTDGSPENVQDLIKAALRELS